MNLRRLQKILRGKLTFDELKQLARLIRDSFKDKNYEPAKDE